MMAVPRNFVDYEGIYLLSHSIGLPVRRAREAVADYFKVWESDTPHAWPQWLEAIDHFRETLGQLIGGPPASICPQSNVSSALSKTLGALRQSFDNPTILLTEEAFPSLGYVCEHAGYEVRYIGADLDATDPAVWRSALTSDVDIVLITHVHSNTGEQVDVADIAGIARRRGVISIVDVAQSVGVLPVDVDAWDIDVVVGSCVKWLSGGPGGGWMWVRPDLIERCTPVDVGWFSHDDPFEFDIHDFRYAGDALRFWGGTPTVLPFVIARHSIDAIRRIGVDAIRRHNLAMVDQLVDALGDRVLSPVRPDRRSGTCIIRAGDGDVEILSRKGIAVDQRGGAIRASPHIHTSENDIQILVAALLARR
jgi:kynureninase